jgi:hypothetical protein
MPQPRTSSSDAQSGHNDLPLSEFGKKTDLEHTISHAPGEVEVILDTEHGEYKRSFTKRQIHVNCLLQPSVVADIVR